jgi:hypothetical protein
MAEGMTVTEMEAFFREVRQGHVCACPTNSPELFSCFPPGTTQAVVVSQTCDVVLPKRPTVALAPVVELTGDVAQQATRRENPRYVHLPLLSGDQFGDLAFLHSFDKTALSGAWFVEGVDPDDDEAARALSLAVGRWFSRFPVPDDVVPWLNPLLAVVRQKYRKPKSPLGRILQDVVEIRIEAERWSVRPLDLTLHVIVKAGVIPTLENDEIDKAAASEAFAAREEIGSPTDIASMLVNDQNDKRKATLWPLLAESMASICHPVGGDVPESVANAVRRIVAELWEDDQFPLSHVRRSELLDVDFLSEGRPL